MPELDTTSHTSDSGRLLALLKGSDITSLLSLDSLETSESDNVKVDLTNVAAARGQMNPMRGPTRGVHDTERASQTSMTLTRSHSAPAGKIGRSKKKEEPFPRSLETGRWISMALISGNVAPLHTELKHTDMWALTRWHKSSEEKGKQRYML
ncbi:hypothetical protein EYF80_045178 [Liparis tanakae]|uniref:Uncharacterized protein n=1 Tax=Liparis tanakae TaxID=230148 RepID=A0A4Z2FTS1_9TELE|nr:hypothetical protein EYF80_045178 [Liparis tanakae]